MLIKLVGTWTRLAHEEVAGSAGTLVLSSIPARGNLMVVCKMKHAANGSAGYFGLVFNDDGESEANGKYAGRRSHNGGNDQLTTSAEAVAINSAYSETNWSYSVTHMSNNDGRVKLCKSYFVGANSDGANLPRRVETAATWHGTDQVNKIQLTDHDGDKAVTFAVGSYVTVYGATDDISTDEKTTLTNVPDNTRYEEVDTRKIYRWADSTDKTNICNYWKMDSSTNTDTATTANGYTNGLGKDGSNSNITVSTSDKKIGTASYEFNGASSSTSKCTYGSASDWKFLHNGDNWSATFWAKLDSLSGGGEILSTMTGNNGGETGMHFYLHPDGGGEFTMQVFNGSGAPFPINTTVNSVFTTGTWNHYAVTFNGTTVTVYKDGVLKGTITKGSAGLGSGNPTYTLHMGDAGDGAVGELDGKLDDFAIWKTVLSASFIKTLYEASATDNITGWKERGS